MAPYSMRPYNLLFEIGIWTRDSPTQYGRGIIELRVRFSTGYKTQIMKLSLIKMSSSNKIEKSTFDV